MKGLLIKDFKILKAQRTFFIMILLVAVLMTLFSYDGGFMISFLSLILSIFVVSTISYDEFDNGHAFLFTLPISRKGYAIEKYVFGVLLGIGGWLFSSLFALAAAALNIEGTTGIEEVIAVSLTILPLIFAMQAIMIPFSLKYGSEKGRLALFAVLGAVFVIVIALVKAMQAMGFDASAFENALPAVDFSLIMLGISVLVFALWLLSLKISVAIMKKKEF